MFYPIVLGASISTIRKDSRLHPLWKIGFSDMQIFRDFLTRRDTW